MFFPSRTFKRLLVAIALVSSLSSLSKNPLPNSRRLIPPVFQ
jgi:hypothetical protein